MKIFLTGEPGCGKSTVLMKTVDLLRKNGLKVGGIITPEIREKGKRVGFYVKDVFSQIMEVFASVNLKIGPRLGKYGIDLYSFEKVALPAIDFASENCDVVVIDEIGKMEFLSENFKKKVLSLLSSDKPIIAVVHRNFVKGFEKFGKVLEVNLKNREKLPEELMKLFLEL
ncbi:MAG: NTPase [Candidatus Aenigmatarchaeota archaeon]